MVILDKKCTVKELNEINSFANGFVKGVVDLTIPLSISTTISFMVFRVVEWIY